METINKHNSKSARVLILIVGAGVLLLVGLAGLAMCTGRSDTLPTKISELDASAGTIYTSSFMDMAGNPQSLGQWQHKLLVINFWATWCSPCKEEMPIFANLQKKYAAKGLQIIGIAADSPSNVANFAQKLSVGYPLLPDEGGAIEFSKRLGNRLGLLPHTVIIRPGGEVISARLGIIREDEFEAVIIKNLPK